MNTFLLNEASAGTTGMAVLRGRPLGGDARLSPVSFPLPPLH